jgi:hypothetical protein
MTGKPADAAGRSAAERWHLTADGPDDAGTPWGERALPPGPIAVLGTAFLLVWAALTITLFTLWPLVEPVAEGAASPTRAFPAFGPVRWQLTPDTALILLVVVVSALGSFVHAATSFSTYVGNRRLYGSWVWWYVLRVSIGATLALVVYFVIRGGLFSGSADSGALNPYGIAAVAALSGLFSKQATDKLREVFDTVLSTGQGSGDEQRADKAANPRPMLERLDPPGAVAGERDVSVIAEGIGFLRDTTVRVRRVGAAGDDHAVEPLFVDRAHLQLRVPSALLAEEGVLEIVAENPQPGGGHSDPQTFVVRRLPLQPTDEVGSQYR